MEKPVDVDAVRRHWIIDRAWNGSERSLVKHVVDVLHGLLAAAEIADIGTNELEFSTRRCGRRHHVIEIRLIAGGEVVESNDRLPQSKKLLEQVRSDEASHARNEPGAWVLHEISPHAIVGPCTNATDHLEWDGRDQPTNPRSRRSSRGEAPNRVGALAPSIFHSPVRARKRRAK